MRIENHTDYRTDHIKAFVQRVAEEELDPAQRKLLVVKVVYQATRGANSDVYIRRKGSLPVDCGLRYNYFNLTLAKPGGVFFRRYGGQNRGWIGVQLAHEMAECRGRRHAEMHSARYYYHRFRGDGGKYWIAAFEGLPLEVKATPERIRPDRAARLARKLVQAERAVARWTTRSRLCATKLKIWRTKATRITRALEREKQTRGAA